MRYYIIQGWKASEVDEKSPALKTVKNEVIWKWLDLNNKEIKIIDKERRKLAPLMDKAITARFNSANSVKSKLILVVLIIACVFFWLQYSNYKWQATNLKLALEQIQKEKLALMNNKNTPAKVTDEKVESPAKQNNDLKYKNDELNNQLQLISLTNKKDELILQNNIELLEEKLKMCEDLRLENRSQTDLEMYKEIDLNYTDQKKAELKNIVKYEYLDEARKVAIKYCDKIKK